MAVLPINELKSKIDANIYQNSNQEITGGKLNTILNDVVDSLDADISAVDAGLTELEQEVIYDVSANNDGATFASLSTLLSSENLSTLIPIAVRCGGMSIRFVRSSDNKYVQYRCIAKEFTTDITQWESVSDVLSFITNINKGRINPTGNVWQDVGTSSAYKYIIVPISCKGGEEVVIKGSLIGESDVAFLSDYNPVNGESAGVLSRIWTGVDSTNTTTVPQDTKYLYILYSSYSNNRVPQQLIIGSIDIIKSIKENEFLLNKSIYDLKQSEMALDSALNQTNQNTSFGIYRGYYLSGSGWKDINTGNRYYAIAPILPNVSYTFKAASGIESILIFLSEYNPVVDTRNGYIREVAVDNGTPIATGTTPDDAKYIYVLYKSYGSNRMPASIEIGGIDYLEPIRIGLQKLILERYSTIDNYLVKNETTKKGYIASETKWKDIGTGSRRYYIFPVTEGDSYAYRSGDYEGNIAFLSAYNPVEDGDAGVLAFYYVPQTDKSIKTGIVPVGTKYVFILAESGINRNRLPSFFILGNKFLLGNQVDEFDKLLDDFEQFKKSEYDIFTLNGGESVIETKLKNIRFGYWNPYDGIYDTVPKCFTLLHFSDIHGDTINMQRLMSFANHYQNDIQEIVFSGDLQPLSFEGNVDYWGTMGFGKVLFSIGNHEVYTNNPSGYSPDEIEQGTGQSQNQVISPLAYDKYIAPYLSQLGSIIQPAGVDDSNSPYYKVCYYYKDYDNYPIRIINLNSQKWDNNQKTWLIDVLADAKTNNKHVVIMEHNPVVQNGGHDYINGCTFADYTYPPTGWNDNNPEVIDVVSDFIDAGGVFVCWLTGHVHTDNFGLVHYDPRQIDLNITCSSHNDLCPGAETPVNTFMQDAFNIVSIDTDCKILKVYRVGRIYDRFLQHHETCSIKYDPTDVKLLSNY